MCRMLPTSNDTRAYKLQPIEQHTHTHTWTWTSIFIATTSVRRARSNSFYSAVIAQQLSQYWCVLLGQHVHFEPKTSMHTKWSDDSPVWISKGRWPHFVGQYWHIAVFANSWAAASLLNVIYGSGTIYAVGTVAAAAARSDGVSGSPKHYRPPL